MSNCCLCSKLVSDKTLSFWDRPLYETSNFVALPSLGSLVEGWVLLVPKRHVVCLGELLPESIPELEQLKSKVTSELAERYGGDICAFEHGPARENQKVGCSVDHAHLHLVPLSFNLEAEASLFLPSGVNFSAATWDHCRQAFLDGSDYLYLEQPLGTGRIALSNNFGSQVFRKAIAAHLRVPERFNWREFPQIENVARTALALGCDPGQIASTLNGFLNDA